MGVDTPPGGQNGVANPKGMLVLTADLSEESTDGA
jgi:hypothetical protein